MWEAEAKKVAVNRRFAPPLAVVDHLSLFGENGHLLQQWRSLLGFAGPCVPFFINSQSRLKPAESYSFGSDEGGRAGTPGEGGELNREDRRVQLNYTGKVLWVYIRLSTYRVKTNAMARVDHSARLEFTSLWIISKHVLMRDDIQMMMMIIMMVRVGNSLLQAASSSKRYI